MHASIRKTLLTLAALSAIAVAGCKSPLQQQVELERYKWHKSRIQAEKAIPELEKKFLPAHPKVAENEQIIKESRRQLEIIDEAAEAARKSWKGH